jgi:hypothetical protein
MSCEPTAVVVCEAEFGADQVAVGPSVPAAERVRILGTEMADFGEAMLLDFLAGHPDRSPQTPGPALPVLWADLPWIRLSGNPWTMSASIANTILAAASSPVGKVE